MSYQPIGRGATANDGTGDDLRTGAQKINENFVEIYTVLGNGTDLTSDTVVLAATNQTLTNKTIDTVNNSVRIDLSELTSFTGTLTEFNNALSDDNFVSLSGSETLTNKTITAIDNTLTVSINDLSDVMTNGTMNAIDHDPSDGQVLSWNESMAHWMPTTLNLGAQEINDLSDVMTSGTMNAIDHTPTDGQILTWDSSMNHWMPKTASAGLLNISEDSDPELGGDLNVGTHSIISSANNDISIQPGTGGEVDFGSNIIKFSNMVSQESDLSNYDPSTYHGMLIHVHSTGAIYYAHNGAWNKLLTDVSNGPVLNYEAPTATMIFTTNAANGSSYRFSGPGILSTTDNPSFVVYRGFTYIWDNSSFDDGLGGGHPFVIKFSTLGTVYTEGVSSPSTGVTKFVVPMSPPNADVNLVYESSNASAMSGSITIV